MRRPLSRTGWRIDPCVTTSVVLAAAPLCLCVGAQAASAQSAQGPAAISPYAAHVADAASRFGLTEAWIWAVMRAESGGNPRAVSPVGAMGLMQIMPATWGDLSTRHGLGHDPFEIHANILAGAAYLRAMLDRYGDIVSTLAAYNAGPKRVDDWRAGRKALPPETIAYVTGIAQSLQGNSGLGAMPAMPARPIWQKAALFARQARDAFTGAAQTDEAQRARAVPGPMASGAEAKAASPGTLFISLSGQKAP